MNSLHDFGLEQEALIKLFAFPDTVFKRKNYQTATMELSHTEKYSKRRQKTNVPPSQYQFAIMDTPLKK